MFSLSAFIKKGLLDAVGKMADYQIILNAAGWHEKGVISEKDLAEISSAIDVKNAPAAEAEEITETAEEE